MKQLLYEQIDNLRGREKGLVIDTEFHLRVRNLGLIEECQHCALP